MDSIDAVVIYKCDSHLEGQPLTSLSLSIDYTKLNS